MSGPQYNGRSGVPLVTTTAGKTYECKCPCEHHNSDICWKCGCDCDPLPKMPNRCRCCGFNHPQLSA